jgi:hypothetical protein
VVAVEPRDAGRLRTTPLPLVLMGLGRLALIALRRLG